MLVIYLKDLVVEAKHGVKPQEKEIPQPFRFNIELTLNSDRAATSDDLADTLDYSQVRRAVIGVAQNNSFNLLERLARAVADELLRDTRVQKAVVAIDKPAIYQDAVPGVRIEVTRRAAG